MFRVHGSFGKSLFLFVVLVCACSCVCRRNAHVCKGVGRPEDNLRWYSSWRTIETLCFVCPSLRQSLSQNLELAD